MPRRKYGRLRKTVDLPSKNNCSRCRSGKHCPIEGHVGYTVTSHRDWAGPVKTKKRQKS